MQANKRLTGDNDRNFDSVININNINNGVNGIR